MKKTRRPIVFLIRAAILSCLVLMSHVLPLAFMSSSAQAVTVGGYDLSAFATPPLLGVTNPIGLISVGGSLLDVSTDASVDTYVYKPSGSASTLTLGFDAGTLVNGVGYDLVLFEIGAPDPLSLMINGQTNPSLTTANTGYTIPAGLPLNAVAVDLTAFGVAPGAEVSQISVGLAAGGASFALAGALSVVSVQPPRTIQAGDLAPLNQLDGQINAGDAVVMQRLVTGQLLPTPDQSIAADVAPLDRPDGNINVADLLVLTRAVLGEVSLPMITLPVVDPPFLVDVGGSVQQAIQTISGTAQPNQVVRLYLNGATVATLTANGAGAFQTVVTLEKGPNTLYAIVVDGTTESEYSNLVTVNYDTRLDAVDSQLVSVSDQGNGQILVTAQPGAVQAGVNVTLTTQTGGTTTVPAAGDGSFSAIIAGSGTSEPISIDLQDAAGNSSAITNISTAVGALAGTFIVNETGAATYTMPIDVPSGVAGMQPELSLNYNSQSGNGLLGLGWSLSGLSAITRCPKTYAQDASYDAVSYDSNDRFCLDGQRLVNVSGGYGADNTVYRTEVDSFSLVTQNGTGCGGPCGFMVQTKSGQTMVYGNTDNARRSLSNIPALHWALSSVSDAAGNTVQFEYYKDNAGDHRIKAITYVNDLGLARREIEFVYQHRTDVSHGYVEGVYITSDKRLATIRTRAGGDVVKEYRLAYEISSLTYTSRINAISECGFDSLGGEVCIPPTRFIWNNETITSAFSETNTYVGGGIIDPNYRWTGDFDGDGKDEVATRVGSIINVFDWTVSGTVSRIESTVTSGWGVSGFTWAADFNGDGMTDIASASGGSVYMKLATGTGFQSQTWSVQNTWGGSGYTWVADFNGDGLADIASASGGNLYLKRSTGAGFVSETWPVQSAWGGSGYTWVADFNGDGLADIASASGGNLYLKRSTGAGFVSETWPVTSNWSDSEHTWVADFNGDGLTDIATGSSSPLKVKLFTGDGFVEQNWSIPGFPAGYEVKRVLDYNGDGLADIGLAVNSTAGDYVVLSNGIGFRAPFVPVGFSPGFWGGAGGDVYFGDFDGDGITDLARDYYTPLSDNWNLVIGISDAYRDRVEKIQPAVGGVIALTYRSRGQSDDVFDSSCAGYPVQCIPLRIETVEEHTVENGIGGVARYGYEFSQPRIHVRGRGFLGFLSRGVIDDQNGMTTTTAYAVDTAQMPPLVDSYPDRYPYAGMASSMSAMQTVVSNQSTSAPPGRVRKAGWVVAFGEVYDSMYVTEFDLKQTAANSYFPYARVKQETQTELDGQTLSTTTTTTDYDTSGNVTQISAQTVGNNETFTKTTINQYDPADLRLGRLTRATVTSVTPEGTATRTSGFTYYPDGLLKQEIIEPDEPDTSPLKQVTKHEYDSFGNKTKVSVTALSGDSPSSGLQTRTTETQYDSSGLFPIRTINALDQDETYQYDPRFGLKTKLVGPNRLTTSWHYDALGRSVREMRADGTVTTTDYAWCPSSVCPYGGTSVISESSGAARTVVYRDAQDREIRAETEGLRPGVLIYQDTQYDQYGRIYQKSRPYYVGDSPQWVTFEYDRLDRILEEYHPDGGQVVYTYGPFTKTTTSYLVGGDVTQVAKTEYSDAMGRLRRVDEELGVSTIFEYDPLGNLNTVTDDAGNITTTEYDLRGRKIFMDEPNMGQWDYHYNGFGELTFQQDNKLQQVTMVYDPLGRMSSRSEAEGTTTWTYDTAPRGIGKLARVNAPGGFTRTTSYDALGRTATDTQDITGQTFQTVYTYDRFGRVIETSYPSGFATRNIYDTNGILVEVRNAANDALYWQAGDANASGQITSETYGNNLETVRTYDPASGRIDVVTTGIGSGSDIQFLDYTFDTAGNLQQRTRSEGSTNLTESFVYDSLNRLKTTSISGIGNKSYDYNSLGNITQKGAVNDYRYAERGAGPHAVTYASGENYDYDANGNMETGAGRTITWSSYNKPTLIQKGQTTVRFDYGPDRTRYRQIKSLAGDTTTTVYIGKLYEQIGQQGQVERKHYIIAGGKAVAIYSDKGAGQTSTRYLHHDHLGSVDVITNELGTAVERLSFSAFGMHRNTDWTDATGLITSQFTTRGFTGHEQLDEVGLVHMNGRVYDPVLGRFLSADPQVQFPASSQSHNRYSYVHNNPLSYTDPSGFGLFSGIKNAFKKIGSAIKKVLKNPYVRMGLTIVASYYTFGYVGMLTGNGFIAAGAAGFVGGLITAGTLKGAAIGAVAGVAFYGVGSYFQYAAKLKGSAAWNKGQLWFGKIVAHGTVGGTSSVAQGGKFADGFRSAGFTQLSAPVIGAVPSDTLSQTAAAAVVGGTASELGGGKFANGATTGAFSYLFNDALHRSQQQKLNRALTADEKALYAGDFPSDVLDSARVYEGKVPWWLRSDMDGITLGNKIYFREGVYVAGTADGVRILGHELVHVQQYAEGMTIPKYLWASRRGYWDNPYEIEAYAKDRQIRNNFCSGNPQAVGC